MSSEKGELERFTPSVYGQDCLEINGDLVPVTYHPLSSVSSLHQPYIDEEQGFAATFPEGYELPQDAKIGRIVESTPQAIFRNPLFFPN